MISTIEVTGNVITSANRVEGNVQTRSLSIDGEVDGVLDFEAKWGNIIGDLDDQTDLKNALDGKANANSLPTKTSELENDSGFITNDPQSFGACNEGLLCPRAIEHRKVCTSCVILQKRLSNLIVRQSYLF